ncbi:hypothetical protein GUITHDRAFT_99844 [Guillardia theta CCMP2712]|uniref:Uncharacterized protein n=1 Tax=Guillardia theta (strain CCMP2712) TaxID=905079 RepID=L1K196_GUITC|nr:hypothetical protein GUITHDRAFT_99844 [Guillardia theta CCMP2712]EKX54362.1 hypothetical protein GUITHDRAFT_99844 [Guillardia theta CCMP2712]|eukprot:XP_005841342.1 hypothetical protein GUITHDRAFT_99844 [Guillardia theta CCMP2712]
MRSKVWGPFLVLTGNNAKRCEVALLILHLFGLLWSVCRFHFGQRSNLSLMRRAVFFIGAGPSKTMYVRGRGSRTTLGMVRNAPGPPAVDYEPVQSLSWLLGSVEYEKTERGTSDSWEKERQVDEVLPCFGVKQEENSPIDFGPYKTDRFTLNKKSWPGQRPQPTPYETITVFVNDLHGEKVPIKCRIADSVESFRLKVWNKMQAQMHLQTLDDDADARFFSAVFNPGNVETKLSIVSDVGLSKQIPGSSHYSKEVRIDGSSVVPDRMLRKPIPCPRKYNPPRRCPEKPSDLDLFIGSVKLEDGQLDLSKTINTGAKPPYLMTYLKDYCVAPGTVFRAEYTQTAAEYKMKNPEMDVSKLGPIPEADTVVTRARDTVLDPDFYISSLEQAPRLIADFFAFPEDEDGPFVGRLTEIGESSASKTFTNHGLSNPQDMTKSIVMV